MQLSKYYQNPSTTANLYLSLAEDEKTRILHLEPGSVQDDLICRLKHVRALKDHHYEALSYVWGPSTGEHAVWKTKQKIPITANLDIALRRLRYPDRVRSLRVDAICINQADKLERSRQVSIMQEIYANAARIIIWLGEESDSDVRAFRSRSAVRHQGVGHGRIITQSPVKLGWYRDKDGKVFSGGAHREIMSDMEYEHLVKLLQREWFRRT